MIQIGEFSKISQVTIKTLRHYDKIGLLPPVKVDPITGYRYYEPEQIDKLNYIKRLKRYDFSLSEIQNILTISDQDQLTDILLKQRERLKLKKQEVTTVLKELEDHISLYKKTGDIMAKQKNYEIKLTTSPTINVLTERDMMGVDDFGKYYGKLFERVPKERVTPTGINGARYFDKEFNPESSDIEVFIGIKEKDKADQILGSENCAMTVHKGPYSTLSEAYGAVMSWIDENDYQIAGAPYELYLNTQFDTLDPSEWITEIYFPIKK